MRFGTKVMAELVVVVSLLQAPVSAYERPYDPYRWCAVYSDGDGGLGGTNCGSLTPQQCRAVEIFRAQLMLQSSKSTRRSRSSRHRRH